MNKCVICSSDSFYGLTHNNGKSLCLKCVTEIKEAHFEVRYPTEEILLKTGEK